MRFGRKNQQEFESYIFLQICIFLSLAALLRRLSCPNKVQLLCTATTTVLLSR